MSFSYITESNIIDRFTESKEWTEKLTAPFAEYDRIGNNKPINLDSKYPAVSDGTAASIKIKTARRVIQQIPTGKVFDSTGNDWLSIVAEYILLYEIIPRMDRTYSLTQRSWIAEENALTVGSQISLMQFINRNGEFTTDFELIYWGDVFFEPGQKSVDGSNFIFIRSWWTESNVDALIAREEENKKAATARKEKYKSEWDIEALKKIRKAIVSKDEKAQTKSEEELGLNPSGIEVVTAFQKGISADFYVFNPTEKVVVRRKPNRDPRGKMPVEQLFCRVDNSNPFGRGIMELIAPMQNVIDSSLQAYLFNRFLSLAPPLQVWNMPNKRSVRYEPDLIIDMGRSEDNRSIKPLSIDTSGIANYKDIYGLNKSQILNLVSSPDTSISAEVGNPGFSRTPAGLKMQKDSMSVDDNHYRKNYEDWINAVFEDAINLYFSERTGNQELQLNDTYYKKLQDLVKEGKLEADKLLPNSKVFIDFDTDTPALRFEIDSSTSKLNSDSDQLDALAQLIDITTKFASSSIITPDIFASIWNAIVSVSGVQDQERFQIDIDTLAGADQDTSDSTAGGAIPSQDQELIINYLRQNNVPDEVIANVIENSSQGATAGDLMAVIQPYLDGASQ